MSNTFWQMSFDLVNLVLTTTRCTFRSQFYQQTKTDAIWKPASFTTLEIYLQAHEETAIPPALHLPKVWERFADDVKPTNFGHVFHYINNLYQNINFTMEEESDADLAFLDTLLKQNNGKIFVLVFKKPTNADQYLHYVDSPPNML